MRLKEKNLLQKFAATLKKFSAQGAKKVEYGMLFHFTFQWVSTLKGKNLLREQILTFKRLLPLKQEPVLYIRSRDLFWKASLSREATGSRNRYFPL